MTHFHALPSTGVHRLSEATRRLAERYLSSEEIAKMVRKENFSFVPDPSRGIFANYAENIRLIAEHAPLRILPEEKLIGAATFLTAVRHGTPGGVYEGISHTTVDFGKGVFNNCPQLDMLAVGNDTEITGNPGLFIVHLDDRMSVSLYDDNLVVTGLSNVLMYSDSKSGEKVEARTSADGWSTVYVGDMDEIYLSKGTASRSDGYMIVFDTQIGVKTDSVLITGSGGVDLPTPHKDGYKFRGWSTDSESFVEFDDGSSVRSSQVLYGFWEKEVSPDNTSTYVLAAFAVAVIATVLVLFVNSRR